MVVYEVYDQSKFFESTKGIFSKARLARDYAEEHGGLIRVWEVDEPDYGCSDIDEEDV